MHRLGGIHYRNILLFFNNMHQPRKDLIGIQWTKAESSTPWLKGWYDFAKVIANYAKANIVGEFLNNWKGGGKKIHTDKDIVLALSISVKTSQPEYILLLKAFWASFVMASASSRIISLNPLLKIVRVLAKLKICPLTIPMPLSSDAFNSNT